jgi:hypothetical protein
VSAGDHNYALQGEEASAFAPQDLLEALRIADVWEVFCSMPKPNQDEFAGWIAKSPDQAARWRRIDALVLALRLSPLLSELR